MLSTSYLKELASLYGLQMMAAIPVCRSGDKGGGVNSINRVLSELELDADRFNAWRDAGYGGNLDYLNKREGKDLISPERIVFSDKNLPFPKDSEESAFSVLIFCIYYSRAQQPRFVPGFGRIARYAWGRDYHKILGKRVKALAKELEERNPEIRCRGFTDAIPLMERAFARVSRLGFIGKNTLLIQPGEGSFSLLAGVAISATVEPFSTQDKLSSCGSCSRCISQCPTGALVGPYTLDSRRCISYLTIEKRGNFTDEESEMLGEWLFGCDICQEVCPFNERALKANSPQFFSARKQHRFSSDQSIWREFEQESGVGSLINLEEVLMIRSDEQFNKRFEGTPLMRAKREGLLRNAACVAANTGAIMLKDILKDVAEKDPSSVVRQQASNSLRALSQS